MRLLIAAVLLLAGCFGGGTETDCARSCESLR